MPSLAKRGLSPASLQHGKAFANVEKRVHSQMQGLEEDLQSMLSDLEAPAAKLAKTEEPQAREQERRTLIAVRAAVQKCVSADVIEKPEAEANNDGRTAADDLDAEEQYV